MFFVVLVKIGNMNCCAEVNPWQQHDTKEGANGMYLRAVHDQYGWEQNGDREDEAVELAICMGVKGVDVQDGTNDILRAHDEQVLIYVGRWFGVGHLTCEEALRQSFTQSSRVVQGLPSTLLLSVWGLVDGAVYQFKFSFGHGGDELVLATEKVLKAEGGQEIFQLLVRMPPLALEVYTLHVQVYDRFPDQLQQPCLLAHLNVLQAVETSGEAASVEHARLPYQNIDGKGLPDLELQPEDLNGQSKDTASSDFDRVQAQGWDGELSCLGLFHHVVGTWLTSVGWELVSACPGFHCVPHDRAAGNLGGSSSEVWINRPAGLVLKRSMHHPETFEREIFWLNYFEQHGEDIAPRLLASFTGGPSDAPMLLMTYVGEMLVPGNAPVDWERQV